MQATKFKYRVSTKILAICILMNLANATAFNRTLFKAKIDQVSLCLTIERLATTRAALFNKTSLIWIRLAVAVNPFPES